jgi:hypothetical protein
MQVWGATILRRIQDASSTHPVLIPQLQHGREVPETVRPAALRRYSSRTSSHDCMRRVSKTFEQVSKESHRDFRIAALLC